MPTIPNPTETIKIVLERITDTVPLVQIAALHSAITLSSSYSSDILNLGALQLITPIIAAYISSDQLYGSKQEQLLCHSLVANSLYLIQNLCLEQESLIENICTSDLMNQCITAVTTKIKALALPALELLNLCTEDNKRLSKLLVQEYSQHFFSILHSLDSESKIAVVGLMTTALNETENFEEIFKFALPVVLEMISIDIYGEFNANISNKLNEDDFKNQEQFWISEAKAQQASLEILTNLLSVEADEEPRVIRYLNVDIIRYIARSATGIAKDTVSLLFNYPDLLSTIIKLQCAGFSCMQNLILNTECLAENLIDSWNIIIEHFERSLEFQEEPTEFQDDFIELSEILSKNICSLCKKYSQSIVSYI